MVGDLREPIERRLEPALLAAAITPGLRSILLFDADEFVLERIVGSLEQMLSISTGHQVVRRYLGRGHAEDDLWIHPDLEMNEGTLSITSRFGLLMPQHEDNVMSLFVIKDLAGLSLAASRGSVALVGADVAHLERHGLSIRWSPNTCWVAACDRLAVGTVSPHLLDRFALRLNAHSSISTADRAAAVERRLHMRPVPRVHSSRAVVKRLKEATERRPRVRRDALDQVLEVQAATPRISPRREIALARLAVALARLHGDGWVESRHAEEAATMLDIDRAVEVPDEPAEVDVDPPRLAPLPELAPSQLPPDVATGEATEMGASVKPTPTTTQVEIFEPWLLPPQLLGPYPEDAVSIERDLTPLLEPRARSQSSPLNRGPIIGVQRATQLRDLALVQSVLAGAMWWPFRRQQPSEGSKGGRLRVTDLYSYRRSATQEHLLCLVIDYTCLDGWDWSESILPFLRWAYVNRAAIILVRVGTSDAILETRAEQVTSRNLLDPRFDKLLDARPGRATPLAHGLFLGLQALRHGTGSGVSSAGRVRFVVVTDGRGNVPLQLVNEFEVKGPVGNKGVQDAINVASDVRNLWAVEKFLVDSHPEHHPELVSDLARALGARVVAGVFQRTEEGPPS